MHLRWHLLGDDCEGVPGGPAQPGTACNDNNDCTINDVYDANCNCAGTFQDSDADGVCDANDTCPTVPGQIGSACDDGNANTINDQLNANCVCVGIPVGPGCDFNELQIMVVNDAVSTVTYEIREQGSNVLAANGTVTPPAGSYTFDICLPDGCCYLVVTDNGGDGIVGGGYLLSINDGPRIIDNSGNFTSGSTSSILNNGGFCVPLGTDGFTVTSCDKEWWVAPNILDCVVNPAVSAVWQSFPAGSTERGSTGYQVWWFDPNGGFSFRRFQSHNTPNGLAARPTRASRFVINEWAGNQLQEGVLYNIRVRSRVLGTYAGIRPHLPFPHRWPTGTVPSDPAGEHPRGYLLFLRRIAPDQRAIFDQGLLAYRCQQVPVRVQRSFGGHPVHAQLHHQLDQARSDWREPAPERHHLRCPRSGIEDQRCDLVPIR
ncbi:MAG: hypothetical protein IPK70_17485 [Flavobacteriales bacterium]|nr:hypothetical protein [Flavobacteriales bacterium]